MIEVLQEIKKLIKNNENEKAIDYIDMLIVDVNAETYIDRLVYELK